MKNQRLMVIATVALPVLLVGTVLRSEANDQGNREMKVVRYSDFGARGDGKTDDLGALVKAHAYANENNLPVRSDDGATYYIGGRDLTAQIQTDTDFGKAKFIIDDRSLENRRASVFLISSKLEPFTPKGITTLKKGQLKIDTRFPGRCLVRVDNSNVKHYIRLGNNANKGSSQTDVFVVDANGNVELSAPIIWDFEKITFVKALPIDTRPLTIRGGRFTTWANQAESKYNYHSRGMAIRRSNVTVVGLEHYVDGEGEHGAPYSGFINIAECVDVTVRDTILTGHKTYRTIGSIGKPVSMGTYDISVSRAINVSFINCRQSNDIKDGRYWGIMGSNYCKNLLYDGCRLSRFDAHKGVAHATVRNSSLGHAGLNAIGFGTLTVENTTVYGRHFVNMRPDYGSTWEGEFVIRNCVFVPACGRPVSASLVGGSNRGQHDFGYTCYLPERITIDTLRIDDSHHPDNYRGPAIFADINPKLSDPDSVEKYPVVRPKEVHLKNVTTTSGKPLRLSDNPVMFKDVKVSLEATQMAGQDAPR